MRANSHRARLTRTLKRVADRFAQTGWQESKAPKSMLKMVMTPAASVTHTLLIDEPLTSDELPNEHALGLACGVNVYFEELERVINEALKRDVGRMGRLSASLYLCQLAPRGACYKHTVYMVAHGSDEPSLEKFFDCYETYLEPLRLRLENVAVFADETYVPPKVSTWSWNMRRAAYYHLYGDSRTKQRFFSRLETEADALLRAAEEGKVERSFVFSDPHELMAESNRRGAEEVRQLIAALGDSR